MSENFTIEPISNNRRLPFHAMPGNPTDPKGGPGTNSGPKPTPNDKPKPTN